MGSDALPSPPTLPGAWSSTWTLSQEQDDLEAERTPKPPTSDKTFQDTEHLRLALSETPSFKERNVAMQQRSSICDDADAISFADDESSIPSDDFYSFISQQDTETTLFPSVISISPTKETDRSEGLLDSSDSSRPLFDPSELDSSLHIPTQEDLFASDDVSSEVSAPSSVRPSDETPHLAVNGTHSTSHLDFRFPGTSAGGHAPVISPSSRGKASRANASNNPTADLVGSDCDSVHSGYSVLNYAGVYNLIAGLDAGGTFQESVDSWSQSSLRNNAARHIRRPSIEDSRLNTLQLSQPDGDNPWTLSLDPTLTSTEESVSQSSTTSLSTHSSSVLQGRTSDMSQHSLGSISSFQLASPRTVEHQQEEVGTTRQGSDVSAYALPLEQRFHNPIPPPFVIGPPNGSIRSRNVIQKTKDLCSKFKRFITLKALKEKKSKNKPSIRRTLLGGYNDADMPPLSQPFPRTPSPSSSFNRHGGFQRMAKISTPSVALSYTPEYTVGRTTSTANDRYTYEYHARPKTLEEIRSKRRFSLPTFAGASSPNMLAARHLNPLSSTRRQAGSILSVQEGVMR
ncbi:hypothetical protein BDZ97DRAFT_1912417 [Flammula alnicola]|nr:hypothetical protein BDZ97DRAFT_1912417 [Flammula alnicola]